MIFRGERRILPARFITRGDSFVVYVQSDLYETYIQLIVRDVHSGVVFDVCHGFNDDYHEAKIKIDYDPETGEVKVEIEEVETIPSE